MTAILERIDYNCDITLPAILLILDKIDDAAKLSPLEGSKSEVWKYLGFQPRTGKTQHSD